MRIINGKLIAEGLLSSLRQDIRKSKNRPTLAVVLIGADKASRLYVKLKKKAAERVGVKFSLFQLKASVKQGEALRLIKNLNCRQEINGIIVQLPLPEKLGADKIIGSIDPSKDADGFHPKNLRKSLRGKRGVLPVFPSAIMELVKNTKVALEEKKAIVLCNSRTFGRAMSAALAREKMAVSFVLKENVFYNKRKIKEADLVVTALGEPGFIKGPMLKTGAVVIDGGIAKKDRKVLGDVDFASAAPIVGYISPVPGGVGPVTIACLLRNVHKLAGK
ncbi:MAG: bifunctional 5,10-methylenetetrahydrofolate dehydrogenase/5,10-methenyltetrahydrofolate cyclohydrolase [Candidatus Moranbacteria bacterium]|nr:bifunctional 5,10-methylenetetrahydrofolate dehydrogenase/5,10-methenyltetrahydrofolate cyclohydrolase [Candidatus Moranbacteria bacterium]